MSVSFWMLIHMLRTSGIRKKSARREAFTSSGMIFLWLAVTLTTVTACVICIVAHLPLKNSFDPWKSTPVISRLIMCFSLYSHVFTVYSVKCWFIYCNIWQPTFKKLDIGTLVVTIWLELCASYSSIFTTTFIIRSSNRIQNGGILLPANPGPSGKMAVKRDREKKSIVTCLFFALLY